MSHTDNTDPYDVRAWYSPSGGVVHDHRLGPCDAPQSLTEVLTVGDARCQLLFLVLPRTQCSCGHQHDPWRREENRRSRRRTREQLTIAAGLWRSGWTDDVDAMVGLAQVRR